MAEIKFTKTELRSQQVKLTQLQKYLPTLQLKKALLQSEVQQVENELEKQDSEFQNLERRLLHFAPLFSDKEAGTLFKATEIVEVEKKQENVAGVDLPVFEGVTFATKGYSLFDTPVWMESASSSLESFISLREKIKLLEERRRLLAKELREVSIRVNLFEKILIPRTLNHIKRIRIFLGDQMLAAVAQAKVSKRKILSRKKRGVA